MNEVREMLAEELQGAAFRRLLRTGSPASIDELAADLDRSAEEVGRRVDDLGRMGRIRLDDRGHVVGSAGLGIGPDRHRIDIGGRTFWTWCAYDVLGIFSALGASGEAYSTSPLSGAPIEVHFEQGRPLPMSAVLFRPDQTLLSCCDNVYEEWCPNSNFFESHDAAEAWSRGRGLSGRVLHLGEASELAARDWAAAADGLRM